MHINVNHTLYVKNLCTKVKKPELRRSLYAYFSTYGQVLDIVALKTPKERGQAFITFAEPNSASAALRDCNGKPMYDKPMVIEFAKSKSKVIAMMEGTWEAQVSQRQQKRTPGGPPTLLQPSIGHPHLVTTTTFKRTHHDSEEIGDEEEDVRKKPKHLPIHEEDIHDIPIGQPSSVLYVQNIPSFMPLEELSSMFERYAGYQEFRRVPGKPELGFIEFESIEQSCVAQTSLHGSLIQEQPLIVIFANENTS
ncbi:U2 small nuclear ribonucleoprotein B'' [Coelomomyces lativittatus]|nr:U2 small nuclear ribonucleoprotein B'' [Coelomomyces lativittatus]KAJ1512651.1 U2 small nuclear ribonucleoprotein B'' [Coelomomyces lativittatus]KAJ1516972.1 U2 small nuclear ribonucleoprotein B'' [Coelomomyces lativittatus]